MKWNIVAIYIVKLKSVLHSQFLINLDKIWYVQVYPQGTSAHQILSRSVQKQKSFFLCSTFTVKMTLVKWGLKNEPIRGWRMQFLSQDADFWICCSSIHCVKVVLMTFFDMTFTLAAGRPQRRVICATLLCLTVLQFCHITCTIDQNLI